MTDPHPAPKRRVANQRSHMPPNSFFYERMVPIILILLGIITLVLMLVAAGILLGVIPFH